jgi:hypothetical protein
VGLAKLAANVAVLNQHQHRTVGAHRHLRLLAAVCVSFGNAVG